MKRLFQIRSYRARIGVLVVALAILGGGLVLGLRGGPAALEPSQGKTILTPVVLRESSEKLKSAAISTDSTILSRSQEFDRLVRTGAPSDALQAYRIAANCEYAKAWQALIKESPNDMSPQQYREYSASLPKIDEVCGDLSPAQLVSRKTYIVKASIAGVHGAYGNLMMLEGPQGMLRSFKDDDEWKNVANEALTAGVKTADPDTLLGKAMAVSPCTERDTTKCKVPTQAAQAESLTLWVASEEARAIDQGKPVPVVDPSRYTPNLPLEVAKKAIADGRALVANAQR